MTSRLLMPNEAVVVIQRRIEQRWAEAVCAERGIGAHVSFQVQLRPGIYTGKAVEQLGFGRWHEWRTAWRTFDQQIVAGVPGASIIGKPMPVRGLTDEVPATLVAETLGAAVELVSRAEGPTSTVDAVRAHSLSASLHDAGGILTAATLKAACRLGDSDAAALVAAVSWLAGHPDLSGWTARQLPIPGIHSKWLETHSSVLQMVSGRDVRAEVRPRLAVVHLTYVDPEYLATDRRRHDAWTTGDGDVLAYTPRIVLIVENRDSRLWFPPVPGTIVVEGNGKAAAGLLSEIPWIRDAEHVVYWGDIDADGYGILDRLRAAMATPTAHGGPAKIVPSILMDITDLQRYAQHGVNYDKSGRSIKPCATKFAHLTRSEASAYDFVATAGAAPFRRIEQEVMSLPEAAARLDDITHNTIAGLANSPRTGC
ncbi:Wadjet anti-phage system protein JetD domain-containing protein [Nocardia panacis]|nr:Wadjet anti-phage system protein JetD domain-containing protein [Nocardia panacis]